MENVKKLAELLIKMSHSGIDNYVLPGLSSYLIGGPEHGKVRLFQAERNTHEFIIPHSHLYDFAALVISGTVTNTVYRKSEIVTPLQERWYCVPQTQNDQFEYELHWDEAWILDTVPVVTTYTQGQVYGMQSHEIHSIQFSKDAVVLMFESPTVVDHSCILQPCVNGSLVRTFRKEDWMFQRNPLS